MPDKNQHPKCHFRIKQIEKYILNCGALVAHKFTGIGCFITKTQCRVSNSIVVALYDKVKFLDLRAALPFLGALDYVF